MMKKVIVLISVLLAGLALQACQEDDNNMADVKDTVTVNGGTVTVRPYEYYNAFRNPMKGWREFFGPGYDAKRTEYPYPYGSIIK